MAVRLSQLKSGILIFSLLIFGYLFGHSSCYAAADSAGESLAGRYELRLPVGAALVNPSDLNASQLGSLEIKNLMNVGMDAMMDITRSVSLGLRYDSVSAFRSDGEHGNAIEISAHLFSVLARHRWFFEGKRYIGALATVGVYTPSYLSTHVANSNWIQYKSKDSKTFSIAGEGGWFWDPFLVGAEIGYQYVNLKSLETDQGAPLMNTSGSQVDANLCGPYAKLLLGIRI